MNDEHVEHLGKRSEHIELLVRWDFGNRLPALADGAPFTEFGPGYQNLFAVGWIADAERVLDYSCGRIPLATLDLLRTLSGSQPFFLRLKSQHCQICLHHVPPTSLSSSGDAQTIWVPRQSGGAYVAPSNIVHSIYDHDYRPPDDFLAAVVAAPEPSSLAFADGIRLSVADDMYEELCASATERGMRAPAGECRYCLRKLATPAAQQCLSCGLDWHDRSRLRICGRPAVTDHVRALFA